MPPDRVVDVLRIFPVRYQVREDGRLDASAAMRAALKKRTPSPARLAELRAAVFKPGNSLRGQ